MATEARHHNGISTPPLPNPRPRPRGLVPLLDANRFIYAKDVLLHRSKSLDAVKSEKTAIPHSLSLPIKPSEHVRREDCPDLRTLAENAELSMSDRSELSRISSDLTRISPASRNTLFRPSVDYATMRMEALIIQGQKARPDSPKAQPQSHAVSAARPVHARQRSRSAIDPGHIVLQPCTPPQDLVPLRPSRERRTSTAPSASSSLSPLPPIRITHPTHPAHPGTNIRPATSTRPADRRNPRSLRAKTPLTGRLTAETTRPDGTVDSRQLTYKLHPDPTLDITGYPFGPKQQDGVFVVPNERWLGSRGSGRGRVERMGVGIELEFVIAEKKKPQQQGPAYEETDTDVEVFGQRLVDGHNREVAAAGRGPKMGNYMALQQVYMRGQGGPVEEPKGFDEWALVYEETAATNRAPWGLELRSPLFIAHPCPFPPTRSSPAQVPSYHTHLLRTFTHLQTHYTISTSKRCATHIHISLPGGYSLAELRIIAQCAIYFEPAFDALVPSHRATSTYAKSSWLNRQVQGGAAERVGREESVPLRAEDGTVAGRVVRRRNPGPGGASASASARPSTSASTSTNTSRAAASSSEQSCINLSTLSRLDAIRALDSLHTYTDLVAAVNPWDRNYAWSFRSLKRLATLEFRKPPASTSGEEALGWAELAAGFVRAAVGWRGGLEGQRGLFGLLPTVGGLRGFVDPGGDWGGGEYLQRVWEGRHPDLFIEAVEPALTMEMGWGGMKELMEEDRRRIQGMLRARKGKR